MKPFEVKFYLYAEDEAEVNDLQCSLYNLVSSLYREGVYVSAKKLDHFVKQIQKNPAIKQFLK